MSNYVITYKDYTIDFTPADVGGGEFGAQWVITNNDPRAAGDVPSTSGDLVERGTEAEMAEFAKKDAMHWVDTK